MIFNVDIETGFFVAMSAYYAAMRLLSRKKSACPKPDYSQVGCVLLVPCHNEEKVIGNTLFQLIQLPGNPHIVVIDDGSTDRTADIVSEFVSPQVHLYRRVAPNAAQGKGEALNAAYAWASEQFTEWFPNLDDDHIIIGVADADVYMSENVLDEAVGILQHSDAGAVQAPVSITGSESNLLLLMQDIEFMTFSYLMQQARHWIGSVGMGGNGQFSRYSAMKLIGERPWSKCLTEDADLGMMLVSNNIKIAFTGGTPVIQHGLTSFKRLLKQRTRWAQGHYQIWKRMPSVWSGKRPIITKIDSTVYMLLIIAPMVLVLSYIVGIAAIFNLIQVANPWMSGLNAFGSWVPPLTQLLLSFSIQFMLLSSYPRVSGTKIPFYLWPGLHVLFALYSEILWIPASLNAIRRMIFRQRGWVKTERENVSVGA